jgi:hypothetical protein
VELQRPDQQRIRAAIDRVQFVAGGVVRIGHRREVYR